MNTSHIKTQYTASDARDQFFTLLAQAKLRPIEILARGEEPMILMTKEEFDSWLETIDVLTSKEETLAIKQARRQHVHVSHEEMLQQSNDTP